VIPFDRVVSVVQHPASPENHGPLQPTPAALPEVRFHTVSATADLADVTSSD
jgi:hypothetical protein